MPLSYRSTLPSILGMLAFMGGCAPAEQPKESGADSTPGSGVASQSQPALATEKVYVSSQPTLGTLRNLFGVIGGPTSQTDQPGSLHTCDVTSLLTDYGITQIRHNDMGNDRGDLEGILNCSGTPYTACGNSRTTTRQYPCWEGCNSQSFGSNLFFQHTDELYDSMISGGFEPMIRLGGSMHSRIAIAGKPTVGADFKGPQSPEEAENWRQAAVAVTHRYLPGGSHALPANSVEYLDIMTETTDPAAAPGTDFYDSGAWDNQEFHAFWADAYEAIKPYAGQAKVGGPGFRGQFATALASMGACPASPTGVIKEAVEFMKALWARGITPDWLGWHAFTNYPTVVKAAALRFTEFKDCTGAFAPTVCSWCKWGGHFTTTEVLTDAYAFGIHEDSLWSGSTCIEKGTYNPGSPTTTRDTCNEVFSYARGPALLTANWIALQTSQQVERAYIYRGSPFTWEEVESLALTGCERRTAEGGLSTISVPVEKASGAGIRLWSRMYRGGYTRLFHVTGTAVNVDDKGLWVLAGKRQFTNQRAVLVSNTRETPYRYELNFGTPPTTECNHASVLVYEIKNTGSSTRPLTTDGKSATPFTCTPATPHLEIGPYQTQLVLLNP